jgi:hypothetical protein
MVFSDTSTKQGIVEQVRSLMRVDSTQYPIAKIVASVNNYLDVCAGYLIGNDRRFQWDDTNHTKLPEGTTNLVANQSDYSFLTDEQGNKILTLVRIDILRTDGTYEKLELIDQEDVAGALGQFYNTAGMPQFYDKIADNIIRLYPKPDTSISSGLKFYFQRTPSYFTASDRTKEPGVSPLLHRGFVIAAAYDGALTLGLANLQALGVERGVEEKKMIKSFMARNKDDTNQSFSGEEICSI